MGTCTTCTPSLAMPLHLSRCRLQSVRGAMVSRNAYTRSASLLQRESVCAYGVVAATRSDAGAGAVYSRPGTAVVPVTAVVVAAASPRQQTGPTRQSAAWSRTLRRRQHSAGRSCKRATASGNSERRQATALAWTRVIGEPRARTPVTSQHLAPPPTHTQHTRLAPSPVVTPRTNAPLGHERRHGLHGLQREQRCRLAVGPATADAVR